jgi:tRNA(Ile2) C34 agmatinyltransferase TiaS
VRSTRKEKYTTNTVVDKEFISCEQNSIWKATNSLQKMLKQSTITVNVQVSHVVPRITGPLREVKHFAYCHLSCFNDVLRLILRVTLLGANDALQMSPQVEVSRSVTE